MKVLLITPNFFDYPKIICDELIRMGYEVDWFDDRPSTKGIIKAIIRIKKSVIQVYIKKYFNKIMETLNKNKYDIFLLISGQSLSFSEDMILKIKQSQPQAKFILYQWDSLRNFPYIERMQKYFDKCYSFDKEDVKNSDVLELLPLFYCNQYEVIGNQKKINFKYDLCFIGTAHPKKYKFVKKVTAQLKDIYPNQFIYFFFPSLLVFFYRKLRNPELRKAKYSEFYFNPLKGKEIDKVFIESRCVLDSAQDGQIGLTMRVFEALGAKRKLITTNADIVNYDFYRDENIYVYEGKIDMELPFFTKPYMEIESQIYEKYSLRNWLNTMINMEVNS